MRGNRFGSEAEEATYWSEHPEEFQAAVDDQPAVPAAEAFPALRPSTERMNIRMPAALMSRIRHEAAARDVPYQSLIKTVLYEAFCPSETSPVRSGARHPTRLSTRRRSG